MHKKYTVQPPPPLPLFWKISKLKQQTFIKKNVFLSTPWTNGRTDNLVSNIG